MAKRVPKKTDDSLKNLEEYRDTLVSDIIADEKDYHTTVTYLAAGALGLFLTINDKFFHLDTSKGLWLFITSVTLLFTTLLLFVVNTVSDIRSKEKLRDASDDMIEKGKYDSAKLEKNWEKTVRISRAITYWRLATLITGIAAEVIFILLNMHFMNH